VRAASRIARHHLQAHGDGIKKVKKLCDAIHGIALVLKAETPAIQVNKRFLGKACRARRLACILL
jgi:hypothetical protein